VLKDSGFLILSTHGYWMYHPGPEDYWRWTPAGLRAELMDAGFEIVAARDVLGFTAVGLQLLQDATLPKLPHCFHAVCTAFMQSLIAFAESRYRGSAQRDDACVYVLLARKWPQRAETPVELPSALRPGDKA
jgi:hypothetical protein